jgi:hypothetical protein
MERQDSEVQNAVNRGLPKTKRTGIPFRMEMSGFARQEGSIPVTAEIGVAWPVLAWPKSRHGPDGTVLRSCQPSSFHRCPCLRPARYGANASRSRARASHSLRLEGIMNRSIVPGLLVLSFFSRAQAESRLPDRRFRRNRESGFARAFARDNK